MEKALREGRFEEAGELQYSQVPELKEQLEKAENAEKPGMVQETVMTEHIAAIVSRWTGIPVDKMLEGEREKLLKMENSLEKRVIGQEEALSSVSNAIRRSRAGLQDTQRPLGSFLFIVICFENLCWLKRVTLLSLSHETHLIISSVFFSFVISTLIF